MTPRPQVEPPVGGGVSGVFSCIRKSPTFRQGYCIGARSMSIKPKPTPIQRASLQIVHVIHQ